MDEKTRSQMSQSVTAQGDLALESVFFKKHIILPRHYIELNKYLSNCSVSSENDVPHKFSND